MPASLLSMLYVCVHLCYAAIGSRAALLASDRLPSVLKGLGRELWQTLAGASRHMKRHH